MSSVVNQTFFYENLQNIQISNMTKVNALHDNVISNVDFKYSWVSFHAG